MELLLRDLLKPLRLINAVCRAFFRRYTEMNSKFGNLAKRAPQIWSSEAALKATQLGPKLSDTGGSKDADVRLKPKTKI
jgi:hypothetical protein